jgi:hypothetical protein
MLVFGGKKICFIGVLSGQDGWHMRLQSSLRKADGVYIVTPHNVHFKYAKLALELGKPVFCEKAFTVTAEETDALIALAREKNLYLAEAPFWTSPFIRLPMLTVCGGCRCRLKATA